MGAGTALCEVRCGDVPLRVHTYKPPSYGARPGPLILVFHGVGRNAQAYRDSARPLGDRFSALIAVPEFEEERFPDRRYQRGGVLRPDGSPAEPGEWTFPLVAEAVEALRRAEGRPDMPWYALGHSAGGQFVGRMAALGEGGARRYVAANPGSHLFPTRALPFPYGFGQLPPALADADALRRYLARPLTLYLGTEDREEGDRNLDRSDRAREQGATRYERGRNLFEEGRRLAAARGWALGWRLVLAPGVGHDHQAMFSAPQLEEALFGGER